MAQTPRLYLEMPLNSGEEINLDARRAHYLTTVLRLREGAAVRVFNGTDGEFDATILHHAKRNLTLALGERVRAPEDAGGPCLAFAPIKRARLEILVEKAVELGVAELQPVATRRAVVDRLNAERLRAIMIEACEQSERLAPPVLRDMVALTAFLGRGEPILLADESGQGVPIADALPASNARTLLVGPEGGFAEDERAVLQHCAQVTPVSLGAQILRAETAGLVMITCYQALAGSWRTARARAFTSARPRTSDER